jgi:hypothetical protein
MNEKWKRQFGIWQYQRFIHRLLASQVNNGLDDRPVPPHQMVAREAMLCRFLVTRPDLKLFRTELAGVYAVVREFCVNTILWDQVVAA